MRRQLDVLLRLALENELWLWNARRTRILKLLVSLILISCLWLLPLNRNRIPLTIDLRELLLLICDCICQNLLASKFRRNKLHGAALRLVICPRSKVLKSDLSISGLTHLSELGLCHLHELPLILDLSLGKLKCFICDWCVVVSSKNYVLTCH